MDTYPGDHIVVSYAKEERWSPGDSSLLVRVVTEYDTAVTGGMGKRNV